MWKRCAEFAIWVFVLTLVSLSACAPAMPSQTGGEENATVETSSASATEVIVPTSTPVATMTRLATLTPSVTPTSAHAACSELFPAKLTGQVDYRGVLAGSTTTDELEGLLGTPTEIYNYEPGNQEWIYVESDIDGATVSIQDGVVVAIGVGPENGLATLREILELYGCPEVVFAVDLGEEKSGIYSGTELLYLENGLRFIFYRLPLALTDNLGLGVYEAPKSVEQFLYENPDYQSEDSVQQITSEEAFKLERYVP